MELTGEELKLARSALTETLRRRRIDLDQVHHSLTSWLQEKDRHLSEIASAERVIAEKSVLKGQMEEEIRRLERLLKEAR